MGDALVLLRRPRAVHQWGPLALGALAVAMLVAAGVLALMPRAQGSRVYVSSEVEGVLSGGSYAWVVRTDSGAILVDSGGDPEATEILDALRAAGRGPEQVQAILLTHGHRDHLAGLARFPGAVVHAGRAELPLLRGQAHLETAAERYHLRRQTPGAPLTREVTPVDDGQQLEFDGQSFEVITLPGHTEGSVAYLWKDLLFTGDALIVHGLDVKPSADIYSGEPARAKASLRKLLGVPFTRIADGHTGVSESARTKLERALR